MNGLEALKRIRQETAPNTYCKDFGKEECCNTIEKELKALEIIKRLFNVTASYNRTCEEYTINILPKPNKLAKAMMNIVTKDEFDLLKEVMK